ncbi:MAG: RNA methyltransferase [Chitinophagaceae bacterium]|nr:RNA methyltransferase [Chitinophagaceae bacterium]MCW5904859.1 RNA methyltransferase [Chitinophagaceae bacterium]
MLPENFIQSVQHLKGFDKEKFEAIHNSEEQITSVRINPEKKCSIFLEEEYKQVAWCKYGFYLPERPSFTLDPCFHAGAYYVQEASSMFLWHIVEQIFGTNTEQKILDVCAAPGGKSTLLASYFYNGLIVSNEVIKQRAAVLAENITKWGTTNNIVTNNDPKNFAYLKNYFDAVVIDAPCSGSGMFRKDVTAVEEWSLDNVTLCSQRQQRIIADVWDSLKENGYLIYSTCSYSEEENEQITDWIMDNFIAKSVQIFIPNNWHIETTQSNKHKAFGYRFYPDKIKGEGFFITVLQKKESIATHKFKQQQLQQPTKQELALLNSFIVLQNEVKLFKYHNEIKAIDEKWYNDVAILSQQLYIKKAGTIIGEIKGKDFVPHHELAVGTLRLSNIATLELDKDNALQYLRKKEIAVSSPNKGMVLVTYQGLSLGWIKVMQHRMNNYYPSEWRILKS